MAKKESTQRRICIITPYVPSLTETFIRAHIEKLPAENILVHGWRPSIGSRPVLSFPTLLLYKIWRSVTGKGLEAETTAAYIKALRTRKVDAVLAEYGGTGVDALPACQAVEVPLIVHFHGYDASVKSEVERYSEAYPIMFSKAAAVIAVSREMKRKLIELGAPEDKVHHIPYGVDCERFRGALPATAPPILLSVARFTPKKAPQITIRAFAEVLKLHPSARLRIVGEGPLFDSCHTLVADLGIREQVTFLGAQGHDVVAEEMKKARAFVQHSVEAESGDSEGTPVAILEAGASGLPVVATRHAGIPDVVIEGETGFLVNERDVNGMAECMIRLVSDALLAGRMGAAAAQHINGAYSIERRLGQLWTVIENSISNTNLHADEPSRINRVVLSEN